MLVSNSVRYIENRDRERTLVYFCTTCTHRNRREEEGEKNRCWLNKLCRKDRKIEKPDVQSECLRHWSRKIGNRTRVLSVRSRALYSYPTTTARTLGQYVQPKYASLGVSPPSSSTMLTLTSHDPLNFAFRSTTTRAASLTQPWQESTKVS